MTAIELVFVLAVALELWDQTEVLYWYYTHG